MPYKRTGSPYWMIQRTLAAPWCKTPVLSTKTEDRGRAQKYEDLLILLSKKARSNTDMRGLLERILDREVDLETVWEAWQNGDVSMLVDSFDNPTIEEAAAGLTLEAGAELGVKRLLEVAASRPMRLRDLTAGRITQLCHEAEAEGLKRNTVRRTLYRAISMLLRARLGALERDRIMADVYFPKKSDRRNVDLTVAELKRFIACCSPEFAGVVTLACLTGAERSVLVDLRWRDVRRVGGRLYITLRGTKNEARRRSVVVSGPVALQVWTSSEKREPAGKVFSMSYRQVDSEMQAVRARSGVDVQFRDFRHAFAYIAQDAGVPLDHVKGAMGHADLSQTTRYIDRTVTVTPEQADAIANQFETGVSAHAAR